MRYRIAGRLVCAVALLVAGHAFAIEQVTVDANGNMLPLKTGRALNLLPGTLLDGVALAPSGAAAPATRRVDTTSPITGGGDLTVDRTIGIIQADATHNGYLLSSDWVLFSGKESVLTFSQSLARTSNTITLSNDSATPGNLKFYGTNSSGAKGWYSIDFGGGGGPIDFSSLSGRATSAQLPLGAQLYDNAGTPKLIFDANARRFYDKDGLIQIDLSNPSEITANNEPVYIPMLQADTIYDNERGAQIAVDDGGPQGFTWSSSDGQQYFNNTGFHGTFSGTIDGMSVLGRSLLYLSNNTSGQLNFIVISDDNTIALQTAAEFRVSLGLTFNDLSPMTALGDTIYGGGSPGGAATRLAGNTTTTRKFLRQTGTGSGSAAPSWDVVTDADLSTSDVTNNAATTSKHGFQKKLSGNSFDYADGAGNYSIPSQVPINTKNAVYTFVIADAGKIIFHDEATTRTYTIPANASVAYPVGTTITIVNNTGAGAITLSITTDVLRRGDGTAGTGNRSITADSVVTIIKTKTTEWMITGKFS